MRAYIETKLPSLAVRRVVDALNRYAPSYVEIVNNIKDAELVVIHINGRVERNTKYIEYLDKSYAVIQYVFKSSRNPQAEDWMHIWEGAESIWSYLDLPVDFKYYHYPLGVDRDAFFPIENERQYLALTSGDGYLSESVREVIAAAKLVGGDVAHLGPNLGKGDIDYFSGLSDSELNCLYSKCHYVSGLRRAEGFEFPAAEGLLCGVRPILFDVPHYRNWYDGLAIFIPETHRQQIIEDVKDVFEEGLKPVATHEVFDARYRFNWERLVTGFWRSI